MKIQSRTTTAFEIATLRAEAEAWRTAFEELANDHQSSEIRRELIRIELHGLITQGYDIVLSGALTRILYRLT